MWLSLHRYNPRKGQGIVNLLIVLIMLFSALAPTTTVPAQTIPKPSLLTPVEGANVTAIPPEAPDPYGLVAPPAAIPEFSWEAVVGATSYRLQLSQDVAFTTKVEFTTPLTRYTPTLVGNLADGLWYWRVRVDAPTAGDYSDPRTFTRQWASPNNLPLLVKPDPDATLDFFDAPTFSWQHVVGAGKYRLQISTAVDFSSTAVNVITLATSYQPPAKLANGVYYWRVMPLDPANRGGTPSAVRLFTMAYNYIPALLEPANNSTPTFTPTFRWTAVRGASLYRLQYSTDPSFNNSVITVDTRNTTYRPVTTLPNDINYYWRVRAISGSSIADWTSPTWTFVKRWYIQPQLLTPTNLYQFQRFPFFSWTPVPGTSYYKIELDDNNDFIGAQTATTSNPYYVPHTYSGAEHVYYWRVTPYDKNNYKGLTSAVFSYVSSQDFVAPQQIYPLYYYPPNSFPPPDTAVAMQPHEDRTVSLPVFMWQRVTTPYPTGGLYRPKYRLQVSASPLFTPVLWSVDTENTFATPSQTNNFTPASATDYYWRVCILDMTGSACEQTTPPLPAGAWWSQTWRARIDTTKMLTPTVTAPPTLLRPFRGAEYVEQTPLFEWWPVQGANAYEI